MDKAWIQERPEQFCLFESQHSVQFLPVPESGSSKKIRAARASLPAES